MADNAKESKVLQIDAKDRRKWFCLDQDVDYKVTLKEVPNSYSPKWEVYQGNQFLGTVSKGQRVWEKEIKGHRYVASRGTVVAWYANDTRYPWDTRNAAIRDLVDDFLKK